MNRINRFTAIAAVAISAAGATAQTVTVSLHSSQNGMTVSPGATIDWTITADVSTGDNAGLALLVADLTQDVGNPGTLDLPYADAVPAGMTNFSRPAGVSNPAEAGNGTGYRGSRRGAPGAQNLSQLGGGQNSFGVALPGGSGVAENANVIGGIGQSGAVTIATGSFAAPSDAGDYTFALENVIANVFTAVNAAPTPSPVAAASVTLGAGGFTFTVEAACPGDVDGNGMIDLADLAGLLAAFGTSSGDPGYNADADIDDNGMVDLADLAGVLAVFGLACP